MKFDEYLEENDKLNERVDFEDMKGLVIRFWKLTSDRKNHKGVDDLMKYAKPWKGEHQFGKHEDVAKTFKAFANAVDRWDYFFMRK